MIFEKLSWCPTCEAFRNFKKEKVGKGHPPVWYCPKCGYSK